MAGQRVLDRTAAADGPALIARLKEACAKPGAVPTPELLQTVVKLEGMKIQPGADWWHKLTQHKWVLNYTASSNEVQAAKKGKPRGYGVYFPVLAVQWFDATDSPAAFENGIFIPNVAHLTFRGPCAMKGRQLTFDVRTMFIGIGPFRWGLTINGGAATPIEDRPPEKARKLPFFLYGYIDDDIIVARGRSGGLALWKRADAELLMSKGVANVYK